MVSPDRISTVFLDRDGVLNRRLIGDYVKTWDEFAFLPGVPEALARLRAAGLWTVLVTNQRGVALGRMTAADLDDVHTRMQHALRAERAELDAIYACTEAEGSMRKPAPGMLLAADREHARVDLTRAVLIGDSVTDILAGHAAGVRTVLIAAGEDLETKRAELDRAGVPVDADAPSLADALDSVPMLAEAVGS